MLSIEEMMTVDVFVLKPENTLFDAKNLIAEKNIRHIPVVSDEGAVVGLVSQRDVLAASVSSLAAHEDNFCNLSEIEKHITVSEIMVRNIVKASKRDSLRYAALMMVKRKIGCIVVVDDEENLAGIITDSDYVAIALNLIEQLEELDDVI